MTSYYLVYLLIISFFIIEKVLRKGNEAKSYKRGKYDKGSTLLVALTFILSLGLLTGTIFFNIELGKMNVPLLFGIGILVMVSGWQ